LGREGGAPQRATFQRSSAGAMGGVVGFPLEGDGGGGNILTKENKIL